MTKVKTQKGFLHTEQHGRQGNIVIEKDQTEDHEEMVRRVSIQTRAVEGGRKAHKVCELQSVD